MANAASKITRASRNHGMRIFSGRCKLRRFVATICVAAAPEMRLEEVPPENRSREKRSLGFRALI